MDEAQKVQYKKSIDRIFYLFHFAFSFVIFVLPFSPSFEVLSDRFLGIVLVLVFCFCFTN